MPRPRFRYQNQEAYSLAYVAAIAATAGCYTEIRSTDVHGIDGEIQSYESGGAFPQQPLWFQLKSAYDYSMTGTHVVYELDVAAYNRLCVPQASIPEVLMLVVLPRRRSEWLSQNETHIIGRRCAYWYSLEGETVSTNVATKTIHIPRSHALSPLELRRIMDLVTDDQFP